MVNCAANVSISCFVMLSNRLFSIEDRSKVAISLCCCMFFIMLLAAVRALEAFTILLLA